MHDFKIIKMNIELDTYSIEYILYSSFSSILPIKESSSCILFELQYKLYLLINPLVSFLLQYLIVWVKAFASLV